MWFYMLIVINEVIYRDFVLLSFSIDLMFATNIKSIEINNKSFVANIKSFEKETIVFLLGGKKSM